MPLAEQTDTDKPQNGKKVAGDWVTRNWVKAAFHVAYLLGALVGANFKGSWIFGFFVTLFVLPAGLAVALEDLFFRRALISANYVLSTIGYLCVIAVYYYGVRRSSKWMLILFCILITLCVRGCNIVDETIINAPAG